MGIMEEVDDAVHVKNLPATPAFPVHMEVLQLRSQVQALLAEKQRQELSLTTVREALQASQDEVCALRDSKEQLDPMEAQRDLQGAQVALDRASLNAAERSGYLASMFLWKHISENQAAAELSLSPATGK